MTSQLEGRSLASRDDYARQASLSLVPRYHVIKNSSRLADDAFVVQLVHGGASSTWYNQTQPRGAAGWVPEIQRLGIPTLYLSDGSVGVGN